MSQRLKDEILTLLEKDREFRYAVAGLIGLEEILRRLDRNEKELVKLREDMNRLREDMNRGFERHDRILQRHSEELAKLREDMVKGFERHDRILQKHSEELIRLRRDMMVGFERMDRHLKALGARWGLMSEEAFREGLKGILEKELGLRVKRWTYFDEEGFIYGYPSQVEVDVAIRNNRVILVEVKSHATQSDVYELRRKAELFEKVTGSKPSRLLLVTPYADKRAIKAAGALNIEVYTKL